MKFYLRLLTYGRGYGKNLVLGFFFLTLYNVFSVASLTLIIPFLEILFLDRKPPAVPFNWADIQHLNFGQVKASGFSALYNLIDSYGKVQVLVYFCCFMVLVIVLKNLFRYLSSYSITPAEFGLIKNLRGHLFDALSRLSLGFYTLKRRGHIVNVVVTDLQNVQEAVVGTVMPLISDPLTMVIYLITMLIISWKLTLFVLIILPFTALVIGRISSSLKRKVVRGQGEMDNLLALVDEFIGGIRIVKAFSAEEYVRRRYNEFNTGFTREMVAFRRQVDLASPITEVLSIGVILGIIYFGGRMILGGSAELKASEFIGFIAIFSQFIAPVKTMGQAITRVQKARVSFARIQELINEPLLPTEQSGGVEIKGFQEKIEIEGLSFGYTGGREVLKNINLTLNKGETLALVGPSGGGKSTLIDLVCRFYDPEMGSIRIDGLDYRQVDASSLRQQMGIVTQEGILFNDTIRANIAYGQSRYSTEEITQAAQIANAHGFISQLPQGYDTQIGERGLILSGGQRQRISIARAVLRNPPILILDEATSALDSESERLVQDALDRLMANRTCIVIAHRLSTIVHADRIAVINEGRVVELGTHEALLSQAGLYAKLYQMQFQPEPQH